MKYLVLLSGCGLGDGSQIEEVILTFLILDKYKVEYQPVAIDMQGPCINNLTEEKEGKHNVLTFRQSKNFNEILQGIDSMINSLIFYMECIV